MAGKTDTHKRDFLVSSALYWKIMKGSSERVAAACLSEDLFDYGVDISDNTLREIYHRIQKIGSGVLIKDYVKEVLQACEENDNNPKERLYNLEFISKLFNNS